MFNFFEQPWTLIGAAVLALFGILTFRSIFPEKRQRWQLALPVLLAVAAFALDYFVKTDLEKINIVIRKGIRAVEQEDCNTIEQIISPDYNDSFHSNKISLITHCRAEMGQPVVEKCTKTGLSIEITPPNATVNLTVIIRFEKDSHIVKDYYAQIMWITTQVHLKKQPDKSWLINRMELLEINKQPVNWRQVK
jgi:hypothetical protein